MLIVKILATCKIEDNEDTIDKQYSNTLSNRRDKLYIVNVPSLGRNIGHV